MDVEKEITKFKMDLLRKMPFYGDIVMNLPFVPNKKIPTARTNGGMIEYNPDFLGSMSAGKRNFILMHEVFHVLLFHCSRKNERHPRIWNAAADMIVNAMLLERLSFMNENRIAFEKPDSGIFTSVGAWDTTENLYNKLLLDNSTPQSGPDTVRRCVKTWRGTLNEEIWPAPSDLILVAAPGEESDDGSSSPPALSPEALLELIRESASRNRSDTASCMVPREIYRLTERKTVNWKTLLREFCEAERSDESSYTTPERKYIHMDLILPGYGMTEERLEEIWAFVDSSGSISKTQMEEFLSELYRLVREFKCRLNICYWDTSVTDVYKNLTKEADVFESIPLHSGGTDINCVYRWIRENRADPDVMLILTDGYFGRLDSQVFLPSLAKKTILVLNGEIAIDDAMKRIGKITRLEKQKS